MASFGLLLWGQWSGFLGGLLPPWTWVGTVLFVDVAHVWATAYRVYLDPEELHRRRSLYLAIPLACYAAGVLLYSASSLLFWRVLAYIAVFHFIRQQYGWVALYRRRLGESSHLDRILDNVTIYSATIFPLVYWHAHLPREFQWFIAGDFIPGLPQQADRFLFPLAVTIALAYISRQTYQLAMGRAVSPGKSLVIATTWLCWYVGIVVLNSDYAFTVTNVLVHGIPYLAFVWVYGRRRWKTSTFVTARVFQPAAWPTYLALLFLAAWCEEWLWDRFVWHERGGLFPGPALLLSKHALCLVVPLLALPQSTHYVLDAWIWRVRPSNPGLARHLGFQA